MGALLNMLLPNKDQEHPGYTEVEVPFWDEYVYKCGTCSYNSVDLTDIEAHVEILHPKPKETTLPDDSIAFVYECDLDDCAFSTNLSEMYYKHLDKKHNIYVTGATPTNNHKQQDGYNMYSGYYGGETRQDQVPVKTREIAVNYWKDRYSIRDKVGEDAS